MNPVDRTAEWTIYESPLGSLTVSAGPQGIKSVCFPGRSPRLDEATRGPLIEAVGQLDEYFAGEREGFDLALDLSGSPLQRLVWARLREIPYGATLGYGELAGQIEEGAFPDGLEPYQRVRAAAAEVGRTPTPILVPCHRVIGADGSLTGYGGGLERKRALLELEGWEIGRPPGSVADRDQLALL
jgi:methylated-DNA-[protein]-cysteine S-methyltransferase